MSNKPLTLGAILKFCDSKFEDENFDLFSLPLNFVVMDNNNKFHQFATIEAFIPLEQNQITIVLSELKNAKGLSNYLKDCEKIL